MTNKQFKQLCVDMKSLAKFMRETFVAAIERIDDEAFNLCESDIDDCMYAMTKVDFALDMIEMTIRHEEDV